MVDLYSLLRGYAVNTKSATVNTRQFVAFVSQYAAKKQYEQPDLAKWAGNAAEAEFKKEITFLVGSGKCVLIADSKDENVFLPDLCREIIKSAYQNIDKHAAIPFLGAANMNLKIPAGYVKTVGLLSDIESYFRRKTSNPDPAADPGADPGNPVADEIIILEFPQSYGTAPMLASMIPRKLMELALIKIQYFLNNGHNMAHIVNTLNVQIKDKERALKECINRVLYRPVDCIDDMERFDDFVYLFWVHFCALVKKDIKTKNEIRDQDLGVLQSVYIIEVCGSLYRSGVVKKQEIEAAYNKLEELMALPPYRFSLGDIIKFTNEKGISLLSYYSEKDLEAYIRKKITETKEGGLPSWLSIQGPMDERLYLRKEQYLPVCVSMLNDAQPQIKAALVKRWTRQIKDYSTEPAMDKDSEYEKLLRKLTNTVNPVLMGVLENPKLRWAYEELERSLGTVPQNMRLFNRGTMLPFYVLYALRRRDVIADIRDELPIWYSNPFLHAILKFFKNFGKKKSTQSQEDGDERQAASGSRKKSDPMKSSALRIKSDIVPEGKNIDEYIEELEDRWCSLRDDDTRRNLILGVKALMKDKLRQDIRLKKLTSIRREHLREIAEYLINQNSTLVRLKDQDSLRTYMELCMLKLVLR
jgi:hypothetical protein